MSAGDEGTEPVESGTFVTEILTVLEPIPAVAPLRSRVLAILFASFSGVVARPAAFWAKDTFYSVICHLEVILAASWADYRRLDQVPTNPHLTTRSKNGGHYLTLYPEKTLEVLRVIPGTYDLFLFATLVEMTDFQT